MHPALLASIAAGAAGLGVLIWALRFADRRRGARRCPKCWYSMEGIDTLRCPECGSEAQEERSLHRTRRSQRGVLASLATLFLGLALAVWFVAFSGRAPLRPWTLESTVTAGEYEVAVLLDNTGAAPNIRKVRVRRGRHEVCSFFATYPEVGVRTAEGALVGLADDINGDRIPDLIVRDQPGNGAATQTNLVLSLLGDGLAPPVTTLGPGTFTDIDGDGILEFRAADCSFAYTWTSGADSPYPDVLLRWSASGQRYIVAPDLMRRPPPSDTELAAIAAAANNPSAMSASVRLAPVLAAALDLIYTGNERLAWGLIESSWTQMEEWPLDRFEAELREALASSPFAGEIRTLQLHPLPARPAGN